MKSTGMRLVFEIVFPVFALVLCLGAFMPAMAEAPATDDSADLYSAEELEEIVGPIALYPDIVLSSMLPASTFPSDVVAAARWVAEQSGEIDAIPDDSGWDTSVEAMVQYPDVLAWMSENLDWMEMLAYAVAVQQGDVLQAVQDFRAAAEDAGNLESDDHMQVVQEGDTIVIQPASPEVVYVPTYNPVAVRQPGYSWGAWGAGFAMGAMGAWAFNSIGWGHHGGHGSININNSRNYNFNNNGKINTGNIGSGNKWNSNNRPNNRPNERPGQTRPKQGNWGNKPGNSRPGKGGVKPGNNKPGNRPGNNRPGSKPGNRPGGDRPGSKPGNRPGGNRPGDKPGNRPGGSGNRPGSKPGGKPGSKPGGAGKPASRPSKPTSRPAPSRGSKSSMGGASNHGRSTKQASSRGNKSMSSKPKSSSRSSSSSRSGGSRSGGSRSGGSRGGGGRGGGGRRR